MNPLLLMQTKPGGLNGFTAGVSACQSGLRRSPLCSINGDEMPTTPFELNGCSLLFSVMIGLSMQCTAILLFYFVILNTGKPIKPVERVVLCNT